MHVQQPKQRQLKAYLRALGIKPESGAKVPSLAGTFVLAMLWLDLQPYQKRGAGFSKPHLKAAQVKLLLEEYFAHHSRDFTDKVKKRMKERPYAEMWNERSEAPDPEGARPVDSGGRAAQGAFSGSAADLRAPERQGPRVLHRALSRPERRVGGPGHARSQTCTARTKRNARAKHGPQQQPAARDGVARRRRRAGVSRREHASRVGRAEPVPRAVSAAGHPHGLDTASASRRQAALTETLATLVRPRHDTPCSVTSLDDLDPTQRSFADHLLAGRVSIRASQSCLFNTCHRLPSQAAAQVRPRASPLCFWAPQARAKPPPCKPRTLRWRATVRRPDRASGLHGRCGQQHGLGQSLLRLGSRNAFFGQLAPLSEGNMS